MILHDNPQDLDYRSAVDVQQREISEEQFEKFEGYASEIFSAFGLDLNSAGTQDTPRRFIWLLSRVQYPAALRRKKSL